MYQNSKKILFQLSGSISCFKSCQVISELVKKGHDVKTIASKSALNFIGKATLEGLSGHKVITDTFTEGNMMDHIKLSDWADMAVLCPGSASRINSLANGSGHDILGTIFLTWEIQKKPYVIFPAMNHRMYKHPILSESLSKLEKIGVQIAPVEFGRQACGETGEGRLLEPNQILETIFGKLK